MELDNKDKAVAEPKAITKLTSEQTTANKKARVKKVLPKIYYQYLSSEPKFKKLCEEIEQVNQRMKELKGEATALKEQAKKLLVLKIDELN